MMKSKIWIYYLALNIVLIGFTGFLVYRAFFPAATKYPDPVTLLEETLVYGETLLAKYPDDVDNSDKDSTYSLSITNETSADKTYYLYLTVNGDKKLIDALTIKIKDKELLLSYSPNSYVKTVTLKPAESITLTIKVYVDLLQIIDPQVFNDAQITFSISDDYAQFYSLTK